MLFKKKHTTIHVTFVNATDDSTIGVSDIPLEQLPEQFEIRTTVNLRGDDWIIEDATPMHASEFAKTGELTVKMSKLEQLDPKELLYSLPTISMEWPPIAPQSDFTAFDLTLHEDDWRQREFLPPNTQPLVEEELAAIAAIWHKHRINVDETMHAFDQIHVRRAVGDINLAINFEEFKKLLGKNEVGAVKIGEHSGFVQNGFAIRAFAEATFYGIVSSEQITCLCLHMENPEQQPEDLIRRINTQFGLLYVDWPHTTLIK